MEVNKYTVRLVAHNFLQQEGADYNELFALVVDSTYISLLLAIANHENWELEEMGVVTTFYMVAWRKRSTSKYHPEWMYQTQRV